MSFTVQSVVDSAQMRYEDLPDATALEYLNDERTKILSGLEALTSTLSVNITASTSQYALSATAAMVQAVRYWRDANDYREVYARQFEEILDDYPTYKSREIGEPEFFYLRATTTGPVIGLIPAPDTSTSGGYPFIEVDVRATSQLLIGDVIYDDLPGKGVYVEIVKYRYAADKYPEAKMGHWDAFNMELAACRTYLRNKARQRPGSVRAQFLSRRVNVV